MIEILRTDITTLPVDAVVNAANPGLRGGGGVDGAIHRAAGPELLEELRRYSGCPTGGAVLTPGYRLPARYVIHAVGPVWHGGGQGEAELLAQAHRSSFEQARTRPDIRTIAFPAISTGVYGYPKSAAARIAVKEMRAAEPDFDRIVVAVFDPETEEAYRGALAEAP